MPVALAVVSRCVELPVVGGCRSGWDNSILGGSAVLARVGGRGGVCVLTDSGAWIRKI